MSGQSSTLTSRQAAEELLYAERETEVQVVLENDFFDDIQWSPLGGEANENNYGTVENQAAEPMAALTELIVNSQDAILHKAYHEEFGTDSSVDYSSARDAANELLDGNEEIILRADGDRPRRDSGDSLNLTVIDNGEGQAPGDFQDNFLGLFEPGRFKQDFSFLHGQYGMGSTGVLPFCGENGYKLIVSSGHEEPETWSWTLIRENRDEANYQYLTVDGEIPTFEGSLEKREYGSFVKLYNYGAEVKSNITVRLRKYLERFLIDTPVGVILQETRYKSVVDDIHTKGLLPHIQNQSELLEKNYSINYDFEHELIGEREIEVYVFKADERVGEIRSDLRPKNNFVGDTVHRRQAVFFSVDGQTHGDESRSFLTNRCKLHRVGEDTIIHIDFSNFNYVDKVDVFSPSRDRLKNNENGRALTEGLLDALKNDETLRDLENRRRQKDVKEQSDETMKTILEDFIDDNPQLIPYLKGGQKIQIPDDVGENIGEEERSSKFYPDILKIIKKKIRNGDLIFWEKDNERYTKRIAINGSGRVRFRLNAPDDYFNRSNHPGSFSISPVDMVKSYRLSNGILSVTLMPLEGADVGTTIPVHVEVERASHESLTETFEVEFVEPVERKGGGNGDSDDNVSIEDIGLPNWEPVREDEWHKRNGDEGWDEHDIVEIMDYDEDIDLFINVDSAPLKDFRRRYNLTDTGKQNVEMIYQRAVVLFSTCAFVELDNSSNSPELDVNQLVAQSMKGVAQALLPQLISEEQINKFTY
jgi:hypothetical protein